MSGENYVNTASTATTSAPVAAGDNGFTAASFSGWPAAPFWAEFEKGTASAEIVRVTSVGGSVLSITRGQGGTAATSHGAGVPFEHIVPAVHFNDGETHNAATTAHGVTGVVVGTTGAQTVQDKLFRGAVKSQFTDALPTGITASFESVADSAAARDGFVHKNTAGDATKRGFLAQQSGVDRFQVRNDGTVDIAPGASGNPGLRNHGTTVLDGAVTTAAGVTVGTVLTSTGAAVLNGGLTVVGTATLAATTATTISTSSTVHANGSIDTDTNLTVDGTSTLTGAVTGGSSITATGAVVGATGAFTDQVTSYGGRVIPSVTSFPASPVDGQVVYRKDEVIFYRYSSSGTVWGRLENFVPKCELRQTTLQSINSGNWTDLIFQTEDLDTHAGHAASSTDFVVPAGWTGYLKLNGGVGWAADTGTSRGVRWAKNGTAVAGGAVTADNSSSINMALAARYRKVAVVPGDVITLQGWHNKGSAMNTDVTSENQAYMSVEWVLQ